MLDRTIVLWTIVACMLAMPAAAQAPAPTTTAFDGTYIGVSRTSEGSMERAETRGCPQGEGAPRLEGASRLTIVNGSARAAWGAPAEGAVSPQGVLVMRTSTGIRFDGQIDSKGTVTGRWSGTCSWQVVWQKLSASTTAFDGEYIGVSRELLSKTAGSGCPSSNGAPSPLTITKGVVLSDSPGFWAGTVSPQGVLVMRLGDASEFDGQIDSQGTIRGQKINAGPFGIRVNRFGQD
jgi:hypothetical protein